MKRDISRRFKKYYFIVLVVISGLSACRTTHYLSDTRVRPLSTGKILKKVDQNAFYYNHLTIKRIQCRFSSSETTANFSISVKASRDEKILMSIRKMSIPVGRVLLTPDSVKYVNYVDHNFFEGDYSFLSNFLNIELDFKTIQSILSNNALIHRGNAKNPHFYSFDSSIESGLYLLESEKNQIFFRNNVQDKQSKTRFDKKYDSIPVLQKMYFNPRNFALTKMSIDDKLNDRKMEMVFSDFEKVNNKDYPGYIEMSISSPRDIIHLKLRMAGFSTEKLDEISLRIPGRYEQINVN